MTTATTKVERSGPAIRAALAEFAPDEYAQFEAEYAQALSRAAAERDLAPAEAVLDRWWGIAAIRANPLSEQERAQVARAKAGDFRGLLARDEYGDWVRLQMPRYGPVWLEIALEQYASLPTVTREQVDARVEELLENLHQPCSAYDEWTDQWTTVYGGGTGLIVYAVVHERQRVIILRLV